MGKSIKLKISKAKPKYKYALDAQLGLLPRNVKLQEVINHLDKQGISRKQFYRDRGILITSEQTIPYERVMIYAQVFDCDPEELINKSVKANSLREKILKQQLKTPLK